MGQQTRSWAWRTGVALGLVTGLMSAAVGTAAAAPDYLWRDGHFRNAGTPVYPEAPDGWQCHVLGSCRDSEEREPDDPAPVWYSEKGGAAVRIECVLGRYYKIPSRRARGMGTRQHGRSPLRPDGLLRRRLLTEVEWGVSRPGGLASVSWRSAIEPSWTAALAVLAQRAVLALGAASVSARRM
jgi:hypothetical protein